MIKAIVFDFVQTLGTASDGYKAAEKKAQKKLFEKIGINSSCWDEYIDLYRKERKEHFDIEGYECLDKIVKKHGNSGGAAVPAKWIGGEVKVILVKKPAGGLSDGD